MITNRSVPTSTVIPELPYDDVPAASEWICRAFGFKERLRIGDHRAQLVYGDGAVILTSRGAQGHGAVLMRVADADRHHEHAKSNGAKILNPPADQPYGERQYSAEDIGGHVWTFSQSIADVDPATWGGTLR